MQDDDDDNPYFGQPSPREIRAKCREIRAAWTPSERLRRSYGADIDETLQDGLARKRVVRPVEFHVQDGLLRH